MSHRARAPKPAATRVSTTTTARGPAVNRADGEIGVLGRYATGRTPCDFARPRAGAASDPGPTWQSESRSARGFPGMPDDMNGWFRFDGTPDDMHSGIEELRKRMEDLERAQRADVIDRDRGECSG